MFELLKKFVGKQKETQTSTGPTNGQDIEDVILLRIRQKIQKLQVILDNIKTLNLQEAYSINQDLYDNQIRELNELLILMNYTLDIFTELKNYVMEYVKEILNNKYISPSSKKLLIEQLQNYLQEIRKNVEKIFIEIEISTENLKY